MSQPQHEPVSDACVFPATSVSRKFVSGLERSVGSIVSCADGCSADTGLSTGLLVLEPPPSAVRTLRTVCGLRVWVEGVVPGLGNLRKRSGARLKTNAGKAGPLRALAPRGTDHVFAASRFVLVDIPLERRQLGKERSQPRTMRAYQTRARRTQICSAEKKICIAEKMAR